MPGTPLMARSRGVTTALMDVSALAPVYSVVTFTSGGAIEGNWVMGNCPIANTPSKVMMSDMTMDRTGLFMKLANMLSERLSPFIVSLTGP